MRARVLLACLPHDFFSTIVTGEEEEEEEGTDLFIYFVFLFFPLNLASALQM